MPDKQMFFITGLPRSGSTLLTALLNQRPDTFASTTSALPDILDGVKKSWGTLPQHRALPSDLSTEMATNTLRGIFNGYYAHVDKPLIFDKSRAWPRMAETIEAVNGSVKMIATVRDVREILASFEILYRRNSAVGATDMERKAPGTTVSSRAQILMKEDGIVGSAMGVLRDALVRGFGDSIYMLDYRDMVNSPNKTMRNVENFLGIESFGYAFCEIRNGLVENDRAYGIDYLHDLKPELTPPDYEWYEVLGDWAENLRQHNFWRGG